ncbi:MAG: ABC transporter permease [Clostridia bacterium]|nr:ABC transporter permease [Clostridia bacterium]
MGIVLKWNFRTLLKDKPRLILTLCSIASTYALQTAVGLSLMNFRGYSGTSGWGLPDYIGVLGPPVVQFSFAATMYVLFAVSIAERKDQYRLMRSAGCTVRQFIIGFLTEALALDIAGGLPGVALGLLIAKIQLRAVGLPLLLLNYFGSTDALYGLLPLFLLVPLMLLFAGVQLWIPPRNKRRKPRRKPCPPFKKRLFPRLFGAGGRLEYAFSKNERRHRWGVVFAVVANLSILFLLAAGVSALAATDARDITPTENDTVYLSCPNAANSGFLEEADAFLSRFREDGLCGEYFSYLYYIAPLAVIVDNAELTAKEPDTIPLFYSFRTSEFFSDGSRQPYRFIYPLDQDRSLLLFYLVFLDNEAYDALTAAEGISGADGSGLLYVGGGESGDGSLLLWDRGSTGPLCLQTVSASLWEQIQEKEAALQKRYTDSGEDFVFDPAELTLSVSPEALAEQNAGVIEVPVAGKIDSDGTGIWNFGPMIILPFRATEYYFPALRAAAVLSERFSAYMETDSPAALTAALQKELEAKGYVVYTQKFGVNYGAQTLEKYEAVAAGKTAVDIRDTNTRRKTAGLFLDQAEQFFFRYFTVTIFLSIALNIVNIVHMNRLSRRREYAILTSIGLSGRQRLGMSLYESFRFTLRTVGCGAAALVVLAMVLSESASTAYTGELLASTVDWNVSGWYKEHAFFERLWDTAQNLAVTLKPYWYLVLFTVGFLFFGYLITETIVNKKMDKDELVPILKDDIQG